MTFWQKLSVVDGIGPFYPWIVPAEVLLALVLGAIRPAARSRLRVAALSVMASFLVEVLVVVFELSAYLTADSPVGVVLFASQAMFTIGSILIFAVLLFRVILPPIGMEPAPILRDTLLGLSYLAATLFLLSKHGVNLAGIVATSAVLTGVIGFSLQDTLGNVMSGVSLQLERTIGVGDVIRVGTQGGRVREIRWRQTSIETSEGDTIVIPNSVLTKTVVNVLGRTAKGPGAHRVAIPFSIHYEHPPSDVIEAVERAFQSHSIHNVENTPAPKCILRDIDNSAALYHLRYWITDPLRTGRTSSEMSKRIVGALQRAGIPIAEPFQTVAVARADKSNQALRPDELSNRLTAIAPVKLLESLNDDERLEVAAQLSKAVFSEGDIINHQGEEADYLYILAKGQAEVRVADGQGGQKHVADLRQGDVFGEMGMMTGQPRTATVAAGTNVTCFRLNRADFKTTLARRPEIADAISMLLARRRVELEGVIAGGNASSEARVSQAQGEILKRIKSFFLLS